MFSTLESVIPINKQVMFIDITESAYCDALQIDDM